MVIDAGNFADPGVQFDRFESTGGEAGAPVAQCVACGVKAASEAGGSGVGGKEQRGHGSGSFRQNAILTEAP